MSEYRSAAEDAATDEQANAPVAQRSGVGVNAAGVGRLGPVERAASLLRAQTETFDLVVIGGGVNGCGVALDAASRGLSVCLVEKRDLAAGTSSRSSKLVHGGLRYLEQRDFTLVREALHERKVLLETVAPHLVHALPFLLPLRHHYERAYIGAGVALYDVLAGRHAAVPHHRHYTRGGALAIAPSLSERAFVGAIRYYDAQLDDARHTVEVARTAAAHGAAILTGVAVRRVLVEGGAAVGVEAVDNEAGTSDSFAIRGRVVVNATGVWTTDIESSAGVASPLRVRASKGIHILVPKYRIESSVALILRTDKSVLFVLPWGDRWMIGTTDTDWRHDRDHPATSAADVEYVLRWANSVLSSNLRPADVVGAFAGLRPLIDGGAASTAKLSREHLVNTPMPGLVSVAGGKYTTYRLMAADAVEVAAQQLPFEVAASSTAQLPLIGAVGHDTMLSRARTHPASPALGSFNVEHLVRRYGGLAHELLDLVAAQPALGTPIDAEGRYLAVEAQYAVTHEAALHIDDVLTRRTRLSIEGADRGRGAADRVAVIMAPLLGWSEPDVAREVAHYHGRLDAELRAQAAPDDLGANVERAPVRDHRLQLARP